MPGDRNKVETLETQRRLEPQRMNCCYAPCRRLPIPQQMEVLNASKWEGIAAVEQAEDAQEAQEVWQDDEWQLCDGCQQVDSDEGLVECYGMCVVCIGSRVMVARRPQYANDGSARAVRSCRGTSTETLCTGR